MDDRMLDGDRVLWSIGGSLERIQEALAIRHTWTSEQCAQFERITVSVGHPPQQPVRCLPIRQQVPVQKSASVYGAPAQPAAFDGVFGDDGARDGAADYGAAQPAQPAQQPTAAAPPQPQIVTPTQPQPQGYRLQPLPAAAEIEAPQGDVPQYPGNAPRRGWVLPVVAINVLVLGLVGGVLGGYWLWPGKGAAAPSSFAAAAPAANKPTTLRADSGPFVCSSGGTEVFCWGAGVRANTQDACVLPAAMPGLKKIKVSALNVGEGFVMTVDDSGKVYAWGANEVGQPNKKTDETLADQAVEVGKSPVVPVAFVSDYEHAYVLVKGTIWCSGSSRYGQVNRTVFDTPSGLVRVDKIDGATQIDTSGYDMRAMADKGA